MTLEIFQIIFSLIILTGLELVLSIDNILFISILCENLGNKRKRITKQIGVILAVSGRILLLFSINWLTKVSYILFTIHELKISVKDIIMIIGGLYLVMFSIVKIIDTIKHKSIPVNKKTRSFILILTTIVLGDSLFSFDSVLAAIAIGHNLTVMIIAVMLASIVLLFSVNFISSFLEKYSNIKILSLSFLLLVGISLFTSGFHYEISGIDMFVIMSFAALVQFLTQKNQVNRR